MVQQAIEHGGGERLIVGQRVSPLRDGRLLVRIMLPCS